MRFWQDPYVQHKEIITNANEGMKWILVIFYGFLQQLMNLYKRLALPTGISEIEYRNYQSFGEGPMPH
jgi:hypothetical protein